MYHSNYQFYKNDTTGGSSRDVPKELLPSVVSAHSSWTKTTLGPPTVEGEVMQNSPRYSELPEVMRYKQSVDKNPDSQEHMQVAHAVRVEEPSSRKKDRISPKKTIAALGMLAIVAILVLLLITATGFNSDANEDENNADADGAEAEEPDDGVDGGFQLILPLDLNQLNAACNGFRERQGGEISNNDRWFACLNEQNVFVCDDDENILDLCDDDEICLCTSDNLFERNRNPCQEPDDIDEEEDCIAFDLEQLV